MCSSASSRAVPTSPAVRIRESAERGIYVEGLREVRLASAEAALKVLAKGAANRQVAATVYNETSSRSHAVFMLRMEQVTVATRDKRGGRLAISPSPSRGAPMPSARVQKKLKERVEGGLTLDAIVIETTGMADPAPVAQV